MEVRSTTRLLKAEDIRGLGSKVAFNYEDIRQSCDDYVEQARQKVREMLAAAETEAAGVRKNAHAEGFAAGRKEGIHQAELQMSQLTERSARELLKTSLTAMQAGADSLRQERDRWIAAWETAAVRLSVAIAEKILRKELGKHPEVAKEMIASALELASGSPQIRVKLNPQDLKSLGDRAEEVIRALASCGAATLVPDDAISAGGCIVETQHGIVDARLESQLDRIATELISDD